MDIAERTLQRGADFSIHARTSESVQLGVSHEHGIHG